jgi:hypothetical protein
VCFLGRSAFLGIVFQCRIEEWGTCNQISSSNRHNKREVFVFTERCKLFVVNLFFLGASWPIETPQNQPVYSLMDEVSSNWPSGLYQCQAFRLIYHAQLQLLSHLHRSKTNLSHRTLITLATSQVVSNYLSLNRRTPSHFRSKGKWRMLLSDP